MSADARAITVVEIGPVERATIPASPHLWLIGPNGSGKSTLARVRYAVEQTLAAELDAFRFGYYRLSHDESGSARRKWHPVDRHRTDLDIFVAGVEGTLKHVGEQLHEDVLGTLGGEAKGWLRSGSSLAVEEPNRWRLSMHMHSGNSTRTKTTAQVTLNREALDKVLSSRIGLAKGQLEPPLVWELLAAWLAGEDLEALDDRLLTSWERRLMARSDRPIAYLPAGRSGIVTASDSLRSAMMMIAASVAGFRRVDVSPFPLTTAAFMSLLLGPEEREASEPHPAVDGLRRMLGGRMVVKRRREGGALEFASEKHGSLPLARMSSAITELGPLDLALSRLALGGLVILEEPESHIHPSALRLLAQVLVDASSDWQLMCTTHSDLLLRAIAVAHKSTENARPPTLMSAAMTDAGTFHWESSTDLDDFLDPGSLLDPAGELLDEAQRVFGDAQAELDWPLG